jgi:hypothetical protein
MNLGGFLFGIAASVATLSGGCSSGETGLVLGRPLPAALTGGTAGAGGSPATGASPAIGGEPGAAEAGTTGSVLEAGASSGGAPDLQPSDPPWVGERCTPTIEFSNHDTTAQGKLFTDAVPEPGRVMWNAAHAACRLLYRDGAEVKDVPTITLIVEDAGGIASTSGTTIRLSTPYLQQQSDAGANLTLEITGILHFATSLIYQNGGSSMDAAPPRWLIVGIADFVRLESGYIDRSERAPGGSYNGGSSQSTAFFLDYLATQEPNIVYELNRALSPASPAWNDDVFVTLLGKDVDTLWADYQSTL